MTKTKRTVEDKLAGTKEIVSINGNPHSPKRLKVFEVQALLNEKKEKFKSLQILQRKLMKLQSKYESGEISQDNMSVDEGLDVMEEVQNSYMDITMELGTDHNLWLLERMYPEAKASGDLMELEADEYDAALEAIFEVNPSLKKSQQILLMNPLTMNQSS